MKYFALVLFFVAGVFVIDDAYGVILFPTPEEILESSETVFVGTITSVDVIESELSSTYYIEEDGTDKPIVEYHKLSLDQYSVSVEEFVKNPQDPQTIIVTQPSISTPGKLIPYGGFEIGDRVLFYIAEFGGENRYSLSSFKIPKTCDGNLAVLEPKITGTDFHMIQNTITKQDNFTANQPITFVFESDTGTMFGHDFDVEVFVAKKDQTYKHRVYHEQTSTSSELCKWIGTAEFEFTLDFGEYHLNGHVFDEDSRFSFNNFFTVILQSPLKQLKSGVPPSEIECREDLVLLFKYDGSPACVNSSSHQKLYERGWTKLVPIQAETGKYPSP